MRFTFGSSLIDKIWYCLAWRMNFKTEAIRLEEVHTCYL
ncbi:hypothetical protein NC651_009404 [Populus alba x Populus x berolinensis]|nr:hypothetical protein NC651_009404 [Populus alba x Populus x berolinensis]